MSTGRTAALGMVRVLCPSSTSEAPHNVWVPRGHELVKVVCQECLHQLLKDKGAKEVSRYLVLPREGATTW
jgi:hypothetical protein